MISIENKILETIRSYFEFK